MESPTYEELCATHRWDVPPRYNIAADVCDKHPRDKRAMIWESFDGSSAASWGEIQDLTNRPRMPSAPTASQREIVSPSCCRRRLRRRRSSSARGSSERSSCRCRCSTATTRSSTGCPTPARGCSSPMPRTAAVRPAVGARACSCSTSRRSLRRPPTRSAPTLAPTIRPSSTTRPARPGWRRGSSTRTATSSATRSSSTATRSQDDERFHGMRVGVGRRHRPAARPVALRRACNASTAVRAASTPPGSSTSSSRTRSPTSSRRRPRCAR